MGWTHGTDEAYEKDMTLMDGGGREWEVRGPTGLGDQLKQDGWGVRVMHDRDELERHV